MKKLITIALLAAMLLSCFAGCAMQKGEIDVEAYAGEAGAQNVAFKTELDEGLEPWDGSAVDKSWYENDKTKTEYEISTAAQFKGLRELQNSKVTFEGVTIKLTSDIDLGGKRWQSASSGNTFNGTFDGQGHVIGNFYMRVTSSAVQSVFGSLGGNAVLKDVSVVDGTFKVDLTANKTQFNPISSRIITSKDKTVTISNVYVDVDYKFDTTFTMSRAGALVGLIEGSGSVVIENCENVCNIASNGDVAGIINDIGTPDTKTDENDKIVSTSAVKDVTVKNCVVSGSLSGKGKTAGIVGYVTEMTGNLVVEDCTVAGTINSTSAYTAGIIGATSQTKNITVKNCKVNAEITGTTQTAGILGQLAANRKNKVTYSDKSKKDVTFGGTAGTVTISGCDVSGSITATTMSGGILGYTDRAVSSLTISDCKVTGSITGHRTTGGLIGTLNVKGKVVVIEDCEVTASLNLILDDAKNNNGGGLIGKLDNDTDVKIQNCSVDSIMKATYAPKEPKVKDDGTQDGDIVSGAAGLIGRVNTGSKAYISDTSVGGNFEFIYAGDDYASVEGDPLTFITGRFVGSISENSEVHYRENNSVDSALTIKYTGNEADFVVDGEGSVPSILPVGYQTRVNDNGTYDLRYIIAAKDMFDGVGVRANIRFVNADGVFDEKNNNFYVNTVYDYVVDEDFNIYEAAQYSYDYLYTLVVTGVPAEYSFDAGNLQVILKPFGANMNDGVLNVQEIGLLTQGENLANTSAANMGITADNFSSVIDDKFLADGAIYIDGHSFDPSVSYGVHTGVKASPAECDGIYAELLEDGKTAKNPTVPHIYLDGDLAVGNAKQLMNATYNFKVAEAGWYDISVYMRLKGSGDTGDGAYARAYLMMFDWAGGEQAYDLDIKLDSCAELKDASAGTYLNGLKVYLEAGEHTVTFKTDIGMTDTYPHIRGIYLAKAD